VERTQNTPIAKQGEESDDQERTPTDTLEYIVTDKLDPAIGSTRKTQQDRSCLTADTEPIPGTDEIKHIKIQQRRTLNVDGDKGVLRYYLIIAMCCIGEAAAPTCNYDENHGPAVGLTPRGEAAKPPPPPFWRRRLRKFWALAEKSKEARVLY
jgi:hypothetical protein